MDDPGGARARRTQEEPGGAKEPERARRSREEPSEARKKSQEEPGGACGQEEPGGARMSEDEPYTWPGVATTNQKVSSLFG